MTKVLIVMGSVRKGRVADKILGHVQAELKNYPEIQATVADVKELDLPFFDSELIPSDENYEITHPGVKRFSQMVSEADTVLILSPEYNHSIPAVLKNAIDWLFKEWQDKKVAFIGYGWAGGSRSIAHLRVVLGNLKAEMSDSEAHLHFMKEINVDGTIASDNAKEEINKVLKSL